MSKSGINIEVPQHELNKLLKDLNKYSETKKRQIGNELDKIGYQIISDAQFNIVKNKSRKTSVLYTSGKHITNRARLFVTIAFNAFYSAFVEKGTRPHKIRAKNKKVLRSKAGVFFGKEVNHPGSKAKPFLEPAAKKNIPVLIENIKRLLNRK